MNNDDIDLSRAPLLTHLLELRTRLLKVMVVFAAAFGLAYWASDRIYAFLTRPLLDVLGADSGRRMIYTGLQEAFVTHLKLSLFAALFICLPIALNQVWKFIAPGLYQHERKTMRPFLLLTPVLFLAGAALAFYGVFPLAWEFFVGFETAAPAAGGMAVELEARVSEYLSLVIQLIIVFGLSFELPLCLMLLGRAGLVDADGLAAFRKHAIIATFAVAALITPPDIISQIALGVPVLLLYEISIVLVRCNARRERSTTAGDIR